MQATLEAQWNAPRKPTNPGTNDTGLWDSFHRELSSVNQPTEREFDMIREIFIDTPAWLLGTSTFIYHVIYCSNYYDCNCAAYRL